MCGQTLNLTVLELSQSAAIQRGVFNDANSISQFCCCDGSASAGKPIGGGHFPKRAIVSTTTRAQGLQKHATAVLCERKGMRSTMTAPLRRRQDELAVAVGCGETKVRPRGGFAGSVAFASNRVYVVA